MAKVMSKKKKKSTYDSKLIMIIAIVSAVIIAIIICAAVAIDYASSYVAKVDGERVFKYEYRTYLDKVMNDIKEEAIDAGTLKEDATTEEITAFWTAERKKEAADRAMDEVCQWKAEYILAEEKGFALTRKERNTYRENLNYQMQNMYQQYSQYYTFEQFVQMYVGMDMDEYVKMAIQDAAISQYREELKKAYSTNDAELKGIYDKAPDDYRLVTLRVLGLTKPEKPDEVKLPNFMKNEDGSKKEVKEEELTDTQKTEYKAYQEYETKLKDYEEDVKEIKTRLDEMSKQLNETGKYNEKEETGVTEDSKETDETDESSTSTAKDVYKDATLADIVKNEGKMFTDTAGVKEINAVTSSGYDTLDEYALTMQWADDACPKIQSEQKDKDGKDIVADADGETVDKITYTKYVVLEDDDYLYVVRCEGIEDFANSTESSAGAGDSIKDQIKSELYNDKADEELKKIVASKGNKFKAEKIRQESVDKMVKEQNWR